jgi:hypothetical protein
VVVVDVGVQLPHELYVRVSELIKVFYLQHARVHCQDAYVGQWEQPLWLTHEFTAECRIYGSC